MVYTLALFFSLTNAFAGTKIIHMKPQIQEVIIKITKLDIGEVDTILLTEDIGRTHEMICSDNFWVGQRFSRFEYNNDWRNEAMTFKVDDNACKAMLNFVKTSFEHVTENNSIILELDVQNKVLKAIHFPDDKLWGESYGERIKRLKAPEKA
jgi:hypothetical protein